MILVAFLSRWVSQTVKIIILRNTLNVAPIGSISVTLWPFLVVKYYRIAVI